MRGEMRSGPLAVVLLLAAPAAFASEAGSPEPSFEVRLTSLRESAPNLYATAELREAGYQVQDVAFDGERALLADEYASVVRRARGIASLECRQKTCAVAPRPGGYYSADELAGVLGKLEAHIPALIRIGRVKEARQATLSAFAHLRTYGREGAAEVLPQGSRLVPKDAVNRLLVKKLDESLEVIQPHQGPGGCGGGD